MNTFSIFKTGVLALSIGLVACGGDDDDDDDNNAGADGPLSVTFASNDTAMGTVHTVSGQVSILSASGELGNQNKSGFSLYTFEDDSVDAPSTCVSEACVTNWPPLIALDSDSAQAPFSIIDRGDGNMQWALRGMPLYFFANDTAAGQVNGQGNPVWNTAVDEPTMEETDAAQGVYLAAGGKTLVSTGTVADGFQAEVRTWQGWTLYTRTADPIGQSTCQGACLEAWPALLKQEGDVATAPYSFINRTLGEGGQSVQQWAYQGKPLYFRLADAGAGALNPVDAWPLARPISVKQFNLSGTNILTAAGLTLQATPVDAVGTAEQVNPAVPADGLTLYTFANDTPNAATSACPAPGCLGTWPALMAPAGAVPFSMTVDGTTTTFGLAPRDSGNQWTINGSRLYLHADNEAPGDTVGVSDVWQLVEMGDAGNAPVATFSQVSQILANSSQPCVTCHSAELASYDALVTAWVTPNNADTSPLYIRTEDGSMPRNGTPLSADDVATIRSWINGGAIDDDPAEPATFSEVEQILANSSPACVNCHAGPLASYDDLVAEWVTPNNAEASPLFRRTQDGTMPRNGDALNLEDVATIRSWINGGALNDAGEPVEDAATLTQVQQLFAAECAGCHTTNSSGDVNFSTPEITLSTLTDENQIVPGDADSSALIGILESGAMPQGDRTLSVDQIGVVRSWIDGGALDN